MSRILAVVEAEGAGVTGVLAGEALRKAARASGRTIEIVQSGQEAVPQPDKGDTLLLVAPSDHALRFGDRPHRHLTLEQVLADPDAAIAATDADVTSGTATVPTGTRRIVAVTSCPTGIAHTFMAAEGLTEGARQLGYDIRVETQGSVGAGNALTPEEIAAADVVLIAADREVDRARFRGKRVCSSSTKPAITGGAKLIEQALTEAKVQAGGEQDHAASASKERAGPYKHLMTGVSFMLPFVVAGGLLIALAFALGGIHANEDAAAGTLAHALFEIGAKGGFALIVPALAGYIAFSSADRPGIAPGMIGGMIAANLGAGFLGGIVAGFIAGYGVAGLNR
uniref:fructose PTS transporter subunit IIB n=1 Tax=uncultured Novosphingobium sp. TaxID=292277 RepID=UPI0037499296